jgi:cell pole-organizing protein PopZ
MEEILASIRRILSEDEQAGAAAPSAEAPPAPAAEEGVLELTEEMLAPASPAPPPAPAPVSFAPPPSPPPSPAPVPQPPPAFAAPPPPPPPPPPVEHPAGEGLLAAGATAAAAAAFGQLAQRAQPERPPPAPAWPVGAAGLSVEDIVRQELRPLLSAWLNANLPRIVEEAVAREMERVRARIG